MLLRRSTFFFFLMGCLALAPPAFAQASAGPFVITSASSPCATITVTGQATVGIKVKGTFSLTLTPEISIQGQAPDATSVTPYGSQTAQATITAAGSYNSAVAAGTTFLLCPTSYASGSATIYLNASTTVAANLLGGGGSGGGVPNPSADGIVVCTGTGCSTSSAIAETDGDIIFGALGAWTKGTALPNGVTATTQTPGDSSAKVATDLYVATEASVVTGSLGISAAAYGAVGEGHFYFDATWTTGSAIVTCPDCHFLTNATVGQIVFGTNLLQTGGLAMTSSYVQLPQTTILSIDSDTQIHVTSSSGITTNSGSGFLVWGTDESANLASAWAATIDTCGTLLLPGFNPEQTGPAVILVQSAQLSSTSAKCNGTGGTYAGEGVKGVNINSSIIMITPNFDPTTCIYGSGNAAFLSTPDGIALSDFQINGAGNSNPGSGFSNVIGVEMQLLNAAFATNVGFVGWGANPTNGIHVGFQMDGGGIQLTRVFEDAFGPIGCKETHAAQYAGVTAVQLVCIDNWYANLQVTGGSHSPFYSTNGIYGWANTATNRSSVQVATESGGSGPSEFYSANDQLGDANASAYYALWVGGYFAAGAGSETAGSGVAYLHGDNVIGNFQNAIQLSSSASTTAELRISGTTVNNLSAAYDFDLGQSTGALSLYDDCGNTFVTATSALSTVSGSPVVIGACSITGTAITAGAAVLSGGWGSTAAWSALSGYNNFSGTITSAGTGQGSSPTITYTFPNPYIAPPNYCNAQQVGGTQVLGTFATSSLTATGAVFTYSGVPVVSNTLVVQVNCVNQ